MKTPAFLNITIKNKENTLLEENVSAISSFNEKGPFDILPLHENFITVITKNITLHKTDGTKKDMAIERGVLKIVKDEVHIYLGI